MKEKIYFARYVIYVRLEDMIRKVGAQLLGDM